MFPRVVARRVRDGAQLLVNLSNDSWLGDRQFSRVRLGVGRPPAGQEPAEFVLSSFSEAEWAAVDASIDLAAEAVEVLISAGPERAMNRYNVSGKPEALQARPNGTEGAAGSGQGAGGASTGG